MTTLIPRLYVVDKTTQALTPIDGWEKIVSSPVRNEAGSFTVDIAAGTPGFDSLFIGIDAVGNKDVEFEFHCSGSATGRRRGLLQEKAGDDLGRGKVWTFTGGFLELLLDEALVYPTTGPGFNEKKELAFAGSSPGAVLLGAVQHVQTRSGVLVGVTVDFTAALDSNGVAWASTLTNLSFPPGTSVLDIAQKLADLQVAEFELTAGRVLRAYNYGTRGVDRSTGTTPLRFQQAVNLGRAARKESARTPNAGTAVLVKGADGFYGSAADASAQAARGRRVEVPADAGNISSQSGMDAAAQAQLQIKKVGVSSYEYEVAMGAGLPAPGVDFEVGDYGLCAVGQVFVKRRISQHVTTFEKGKPPTAVVALNDLVLDPLVALYRKLAALTDGGAVVGTSTAGDVDTTIPNPPTGVTTSSLAYLEGPYSLAAVTVGWTPATTNTDGSAYSDVGGYRVQIQYPNNSTAWTPAGEIGGQQSSLQIDAEPGSVISVRVSTFDTSGHSSAWATLVGTHTVAKDNVPPDTPSTPTAADYLGVLICTWDGKTSSGGAMPLDLRYVEVHMSTSNTFTPVTPTPTVPGATYQGRLYGPGPFAVADLPYDGTQRFFKLVAVDNAGNRSPASATSAGATPAQVVSADVFAGAIGSLQLADLAVTTAKVNLLAVNTAQVGSLAVGKLATGTMTAVITNAGSIIAGTPGAGRTEQDSAGFRVYNPSNVQILGFGTNGYNFMTGEFRTAISGQRMVINPNGTLPDTLNLYPNGSGDFARIMARTSPSDGTAAILIDGGAASGTTRGRLGAYKGEAFVSCVTSDAGGDSSSGFSLTAVSCNSTNINTWTQGRINFAKYSGATPLANSGAWILWASGSVSNCPVFGANTQDSGLKLDGGTTCATNAIGTLFGPFKASVVTQTSTVTEKVDVRDVRQLLTPSTVFSKARAKTYKMIAEVAQHGDDAHTRFGPVAEDLPPELVWMTPKADGSGLEPSVSLGDQLGMLWAMENERQDQEFVSTSATAIVPTGTRLAAGQTVEVPVTWDSNPPGRITGGIATINSGIAWAGKVTAWTKPGSYTSTGATVVFKNISSTLIVALAAAAGGISASVTGLGLYTPPYVAPAAA